MANPAWVKGVSGNPGGRKKSKLKIAFDAWFAEPANVERFMQAGINAAMEGDVGFWKYIADREMGKIEETDSLRNDLLDRIIASLRISGVPIGGPPDSDAGAQPE